MIGIIAAMRAEARTARPLADANHRIITSGIGIQRARAAAQALLDDGAERLLVWGTAGALRNDLTSGALILPREVLTRDNQRYTVTPDWHDHLLQQVPAGMTVSNKPLVTVSRPVSGHGAKAALNRDTGAVAVDMETAAIAELAAERGIPFAAVRVIADPLELRLPPVLLKSRYGRLLPLEVALRLLGRPRDFPGLMRLSKAMNAAKHGLASFARTLAESGSV